MPLPLPLLLPLLPLLWCFVLCRFTAVVKAVKAAAPKAKQLLLLPFTLGHKEIATVVSALADPSVVFGNTTGFYDGANGLHPFGYNHIANIAPKVAELALPLLVGA